MRAALPRVQIVLTLPTGKSLFLAYPNTDCLLALVRFHVNILLGTVEIFYSLIWIALAAFC